jgi:hypothetical protein
MVGQPQPQNAMPDAAAPRKNCRRVLNPSVCCMDLPDDRNEKSDLIIAIFSCQWRDEMAADSGHGS